MISFSSLLHPSTLLPHNGNSNCETSSGVSYWISELLLIRAAHHNLYLLASRLMMVMADQRIAGSPGYYQDYGSNWMWSVGTLKVQPSNGQTPITSRVRHFYSLASDIPSITNYLTLTGSKPNPSRLTSYSPECDLRHIL